MGRLYEIASSGIDEQLQGLGGDPFNGSSATGLRVPTLATPDAQHRYLFLACQFSLGENARAIIRGWRQLVTLGALVSPAGTGETGNRARFVEQEVTSPVFRLPDGNVSFHLRRLGPPNARGWPQYQPSNLTDLRSFKKGWADGPALLYQSYTIPAADEFYVDLTAYTPPNLGRPWGTSLSDGQLNAVYDLRTQWRTHGAWDNSLDLVVDGPDTIAMFISVQQSAGATPITVGGVPATLAQMPNGIPEEQFITAMSALGLSVIYWRVGASLIVEM